MLCHHFTQHPSTGVHESRTLFAINSSFYYYCNSDQRLADSTSHLLALSKVSYMRYRPSTMLHSRASEHLLTLYSIINNYWKSMAPKSIHPTINCVNTCKWNGTFFQHECDVMLEQYYSWTYISLTVSILKDSLSPHFIQLYWWSWQMKLIDL